MPEQIRNVNFTAIGGAHDFTTGTEGVISIQLPDDETAVIEYEGITHTYYNIHLRKAESTQPTFNQIDLDALKYYIKALQSRDNEPPKSKGRFFWDDNLEMLCFRDEENDCTINVGKLIESLNELQDREKATIRTKCDNQDSEKPISFYLALTNNELHTIRVDIIDKIKQDLGGLDEERKSILKKISSLANTPKCQLSNLELIAIQTDVSHVISLLGLTGSEKAIRETALVTISDMLKVIEGS